MRGDPSRRVRPGGGAASGAEQVAAGISSDAERMMSRAASAVNIPPTWVGLCTSLNG